MDATNLCLPTASIPALFEDFCRNMTKPLEITTDRV